MVDRQTVYAGQIPLETDQLKQSQNTMVGLAKLAAGVLGTSTFVNGFTVTPTTPAGLNVIVTAGEIYQIANLEQSTWSSLSADTHSILKQGILLDPLTMGITPPSTVGFSQNFLVEVQYQDTDSGSTVLPYFNSSNPSLPFSGPGNAGTAQNTVRKGLASVQIKAGIAATTGTQTTPTPDAGWTGIYVVTVANGAATITSGNISVYSGAPFLATNGYLPQIPTGVQGQSWVYWLATGTANAITIAPAPAISAYAAGQCFKIKINTTNTAGVTINVNGLGAKSLVYNDGSAIQKGDLIAGSVIDVEYDGTNFQCLTRTQSSIRTIARNISRTIFTAPGAYTFTVPAGVSYVYVRIWGAGAGGGYGASGTPGGAASGGGGGAYTAIGLSVSPGDTITGSVGTGGAGSSAVGTNGLVGGSSTATYGGTTYTSTGGTGGLSAAAGVTQSAQIGGTSTNGDVTSSYGQISQNGYFSYNGTVSSADGGSGGLSPGGGGFGGSGGIGPGNTGIAPGGGGAGGGGTSGSGASGGNGANGAVWFEY